MTASGPPRKTLRDRVIGAIPWSWRLSVRRQLRRLRRREVVHVLHIRKTGGTAVKAALQPMRRRGRYDLELHWHDTTLENVPRGERVVFFLRDPVARFVSGFDDLYRQSAPRYRHEWTEAERVAFERFQTPAELALALRSGDLERREAAVAAMRSIEHVKTSLWDWIGDETAFRERLDDVFYVGFQETLEADFAELRERLDLPRSIRLRTDEVIAHRRPDQPEPLPPEAIAAIRDWYSADYELIRLVEETVLRHPAPVDLE